MKLLKEHHEEFCHTEALDNVPKWGIRGNGTNDWVHMAKQPPDTENYTLLYCVRRNIKDGRLAMTEECPLSADRQYT